MDRTGHKIKEAYLMHFKISHYIYNNTVHKILITKKAFSYTDKVGE